MVVFIFLGIFTNNGWSLFYSFAISSMFCVGLFVLRSYVIHKLFESRVRRQENVSNLQRKKVKRANIAIFASIQILFNFLVILPIFIGELTNALSQNVVFEQISLYVLTGIYIVLQLSVQIVIGVQKHK